MEEQSQHMSEATTNQDKILAALNNPEWSWRTLSGIATDTGISETEVRDILEKIKDRVRVGVSESQGPIFQLKNRVDGPSESLKETLLDYLSMGRRRIA